MRPRTASRSPIPQIRGCSTSWGSTPRRRSSSSTSPPALSESEGAAGRPSSRQRGEHDASAPRARRGAKPSPRAASSGKGGRAREPPAGAPRGAAQAAPAVGRVTRPAPIHAPPPHTCGGGAPTGVAQPGRRTGLRDRPVRVRIPPPVLIPSLDEGRASGLRPFSCRNLVVVEAHQRTSDLPSRRCALSFVAVRAHPSRTPTALWCRGGLRAQFDALAAPRPLSALARCPRTKGIGPGRVGEPTGTSPSLPTPSSPKRHRPGRLADRDAAVVSRGSSRGGTRKPTSRSARCA